MTQHDLPIHRLDEHTVEQFLSEHLPRCDYPHPVLRVLGDLRAALGHLLDVLRELGVVLARTERRHTTWTTAHSAALVAAQVCQPAGCDRRVAAR